MDNRKEIILSDIPSLIKQQDQIVDKRQMHKWERVPFETEKVSGAMLSAMAKSHPQEVYLEPNLTGWYKIFVALPIYGDCFDQTIWIKLSGDGSFRDFAPDGANAYAYHSIVESFWRCADMTSQNIHFAKHSGGINMHAMLAWMRFVPMTEEEVAAYKADKARTDTKRIYATHDIHGMLGAHAPQNPDEWHTLLQNFVDSDVEWASLENITIFDGEPSTGSFESFAFTNEFDERVQTYLKQQCTPATYTDLCSYGRSQGLKMCLSIRMGAWGIEFPDDQAYFVNSFCESHPQCRCVDRDGDPVDAMSYIYPEVQDYVINELVWMAKCNPDAVEIMFHRGVPYVLFEEPFVKRFMDTYGEDPRYLPLDDDRVVELRCEVMTEFVRRLRARIDEERAKAGLGRCRIHARTQFSVYDSRLVAVDFPRWAKEGLIDAVISYPQRLRENLSGDVWQDESKTKLDIAKYHAFMRSTPRTIIMRRGDFQFIEPLEDSRGVLQGPKSMQERVAEFMELKEKYGTDIYLEIMPRTMSNEQYRQRAIELYDCGASGISLWDTYNRAPRLSAWTMISRLGHKDELKTWDDGEGTLVSTHRILKLRDKDISRYLPAWGG